MTVRSLLSHPMTVQNLIMTVRSLLLSEIFWLERILEVCRHKHVSTNMGCPKRKKAPEGALHTLTGGSELSAKLHAEVAVSITR
jgi:hypothetical protein